MKRLVTLALPAILLPGAALAHPGHGEAAGLAHGFLHPLLGADHVLAMVAVGAGLGMAGIALPFAETAIAVSVVAFGLAAAFGLGLPVAALSVLVGGFALFHGYAHGVEMPETASGLVYGLGFLAGTAILHAVGIGLGLIAARGRRATAAPVLGGLTAVAGVALLAMQL